MDEKNRAMIEGAIVVARESGAAAVILAGWLPEERRCLKKALGDRRIISAGHPTDCDMNMEDSEVLVLPRAAAHDH